MKKVFFLIAPASLLLAGCDRQASAPPVEDAAIVDCDVNATDRNEEAAVCPENEEIGNGSGEE